MRSPTTQGASFPSNGQLEIFGSVDMTGLCLRFGLQKAKSSSSSARRDRKVDGETELLTERILSYRRRHRRNAGEELSGC
jgi:hypothetical protein